MPSSTDCLNAKKSKKKDPWYQLIDVGSYKSHSVSAPVVFVTVAFLSFGFSSGPLSYQMSSGDDVLFVCEALAETASFEKRHLVNSEIQTSMATKNK